MKKFLAIIAIGAFAACNGTSSTEAKVDSAATSVKAVADSATSAVKAAADSTVKKVDSVAAKVDSAVKK